MNTLPVIRSNGWDIIASMDSAINAYQAIQEFIGTHAPQAIIHTQKIVAPTYAESRGIYTRECYALYKSILESIKISQEWIAIEIHSTYHTTSADKDLSLATINGEPTQIKAYTFTPPVFLSPWDDISMQLEWTTPWGWIIEPFSRDYDSSHYFYNETNRLLVACTGDKINELAFYGFTIDMPKEIIGFSLAR